MSNNPKTQPLDFEATMIGQQQSDFDVTIVGEESPNFEATIIGTENRQEIPHSFEETPSSDLIKLNEAQSAVVVTLVNKILAKAVEKQATHLQIEPEENFLSIRYRQGESFKPLIDPLPKKFTSAIISRLKLMAELDITQHQTHQKGRIRKRGGGRTIHFSVQTQPSFYGEKVLIRVLDSAIQPLSLSQLIPDQVIRKSFQPVNHRSSGLLLVTSPHKSDPSVLLYGLLWEENRNPKAIATVEESMSYILPGIKQIEVNPDTEQDYADVLQSLVGQDKQRIMVDRLPDPSVARMVAEMARNDHFMLTSLRAEDGITAIALLSQMVTPSLLADTLIGVIHQHSVRCLCPTCRTVHQPSAEEFAHWRIPPEKQAQITFYQARSLNETEVEQAREKGRLCRQCNGKGYHGEIQLYELFQSTPALRTAIAQGAEREVLKQVALSNQETSPLEAGLGLVYQGQTTLAELTRLFPDYLRASLPDEGGMMLPGDVTQRLATVEQLLMTLTQEFHQLKQALNPTISPETPSTMKPLDQAEAFKETEIPIDLPQEIDLCQKTITSGVSFYEELTDPGDWEALKRELDPNKETIAADFSPDQDLAMGEGNNPFRSIPDPWS
ncbi:ATPase, T2SS/T4P/T4SS family [Crocosphaera sp. UHCC 0190]|uniref:GspE/PulE family protein n=1 Tax=Crocosphaera sp. UHCC 0190 TaxID=3110246 RepID=UPI002B20EB1B|nr:ATPase, T2SS/T4P/T4SS family [Crocosphaera sp. UHCC 0190]MEA5511566.1 ATPase, T2SS/T4P/T4SS family [Crocosphaera sp. UHCC 0190]